MLIELVARGLGDDESVVVLSVEGRRGDEAFVVEVSRRNVGDDSDNVVIDVERVGKGLVVNVDVDGS